MDWVLVFLVLGLISGFCIWGRGQGGGFDVDCEGLVFLFSVLLFLSGSRFGGRRIGVEIGIGGD